jgi:ATP-dependent Clp protease ATP-binding subunit ClpB
VLDAVGHFFKPELINRLDELLVFNKLPPGIILDIVDLRLRETQSRLSSRRISLDVTNEAKRWLATKGYSEQFGARAVSRVIRDKVVTRLAASMLEGQIKDGEIVTIAVDQDKDELEITSRPDPAIVVEPQGTERHTATLRGGQEERPIEILEDEEGHHRKV